MELSVSGAKFIRLHEGFVANYYRDPVGVGTIGIGFTWGSDAFRRWWQKNRPGVTFGPGAKMTRQEAEDALILICREQYGRAVDRFFGKPRAQHIFDASTSVVFNCGEGTLRDHWAESVRAGNIPLAAGQLRNTRVTAKGRRLSGLVRRRTEEADLLEHKNYGFAPAAMPSPTPVLIPEMPADAMADGMLIRGERGPAVASLIVSLSTLSFYNGNLDDVFGYGTEAAVLAFQRANKIGADGVVGPETLAAITAALEKKAGQDAPKPLPDKTPALTPETLPGASLGQGGGLLSIFAAALARIFGGKR